MEIDTDEPARNGAPDEIIEPRSSDVGGVPVARLLPKATRRTVGAWCFLDHAGPTDLATASMQVGPHPHIGLHTVTWMLEGELVHRDSLGNEQVLRPGELNVMTAGDGIAHAEQVPSRASGRQHLVQLWVAQPEETRHGASDFVHHPDLPTSTMGDSLVTVLVGELGDVRSPARADTPLVGADVVVRGTVDLPLRVDFEHAILAVDGPVQIGPGTLLPGRLAHLAPGRDHVRLTAGAVRVLLLGGTPFPERIMMHWNFVGRDAAQLARATDEWNDGSERFGQVGGGLTRIQAPPMRAR